MGSSSTEQNYRRIRNKFNAGNGGTAVEMRKLQNGGLVYPVQPPKSAPLPRKMYPQGWKHPYMTNIVNSGTKLRACVFLLSCVHPSKWLNSRQPRQLRNINRK